MMRYLSVCSGIEAASVAWDPLGWEPAAFAEIEPFPSAVLKYRFPEVPNLGDFTRIGREQVGAIDLLVGGTPCQDFSVAGLRAGLDGKRGQLTIEFVRLAECLRPRWLVWENVPGVLSADGGRAFGTFLGSLGQLGYGFSYRVFDAQHFGVPQRRRRVFLVGYLGDWRPPAAVLFERESLSWHPAPRREAGQVAPTIPSRSTAGGGLGTDFDCDGGLIAAHVAPTLSSSGAGVERTGNERTEADFLIAFTCKDHGADAGGLAPTLRAMEFDGSHANAGGQVAIAHTLRADGFDASEDGTGRGTPLVPLYYSHDYNQDRVYSPAGAHEALTTARRPNFLIRSSVRRLTPRECERLQGFPDDWTLVPYRGKPAADGPRYRALGNSMAVPCMAWIGERIQMVEDIVNQREEVSA